MPNTKNVSNPLRIDPSRTASIRSAFERELNRRFAAIIKAVDSLLLADDVLGGKKPKNQFTFNAASWTFMSSPQKIAQFEQWIASVVSQQLDQKDVDSGEDVWSRYINWAFKQGGGRSFDAAKKGKKKSKEGWYEGTRDQFLNSSFNTPLSVERLKVLAGRTFKDLKGVGTHTAQVLTKELTDGLMSGIAPKQIAENIRARVRMSAKRAVTIARTEVIRAHAEGQLNALEALGIEETSVNAEWVATKDGRVCPRCASMNGKVLKVKDSHGLIPLHPNCRCAFAPSFEKPDPNISRIRKRLESSILTASRRSK